MASARSSRPDAGAPALNLPPKTPQAEVNDRPYEMHFSAPNSAGATPSTSEPVVPIDVFLTASGARGRAGAAYIWRASDVFRLRKEFRILGDFCGTLPKHTAQNQYLSVPLVLSYDELHFGVQRGFLRMLRDSFEHDYRRPTSHDVAAFYEQRRENEEKHAEEALLHQEKQRLKQMEMLKADGPQPRTSKKRPREVAKVHAPEETREQDVGPRDAKIAKTEPVTFLGKVAFHIRSTFFSMFPRLAPTADVSGRPVQGAFKFEAKPVVVKKQEDDQVSDIVAHKSADPALASKANAAHKQVPDEGNTINGTDKERMRALLDRRKQQAKLSALVVTPTVASAEERDDYEEIIDAILPRDISRERLLQRQIVFEDLYDKGYCMSCGAKFGADFLAYAGDPLLFHASLAVIVMSGEEDVSPLDIVALGRLGDSTKKRTVLAFVEGDPTSEYEVRYLGVQWEETLP